MIRNYLAYLIGGEMDDLKFTTTVQFVDLYINGVYEGVYLVCEQVQTGDNRVQISESTSSVDTGYLLEMDNRAVYEGEEGKDYFNVEGKNYTIKTPDTDSSTFTSEYVAFIQKYLQDTMKALKSGNYGEVQKYINVNTFADAYIVHELFHSVDVGSSSFYLYKDAEGKLNAGPIWDFDMSVGNWAHWPAAVKIESLFAKSQNDWYKLLLEYKEFSTLVYEKLNGYAEKIINTIDNAIATVCQMEDTFNRNYEKWQTLGVYVYENPKELLEISTWKGHVEYVRDWLNKSLEYLLTEYKPETANDNGWWLD
jgi:hypothetical protein